MVGLVGLGFREEERWGLAGGLGGKWWNVVIGSTEVDGEREEVSWVNEDAGRLYSLLRVLGECGLEGERLSGLCADWLMGKEWLR